MDLGFVFSCRFSLKLLVDENALVNQAVEEGAPLRAAAMGVCQKLVIKGKLTSISGSVMAQIGPFVQRMERAYWVIK